jgi:hypothetical protein
MADHGHRRRDGWFSCIAPGTVASGSEIRSRSAKYTPIRDELQCAGRALRSDPACASVVWNPHGILAAWPPTLLLAPLNPEAAVRIRKMIGYIEIPCTVGPGSGFAYRETILAWRFTGVTLERACHVNCWSILVSRDADRRGHDPAQPRVLLIRLDNNRVGDIPYVPERGGSGCRHPGKPKRQIPSAPSTSNAQISSASATSSVTAGVGVNNGLPT